MVQRRAAYGSLVIGLAALYTLVFWMVAHGLVARSPGTMGAAITFDLTVTAALATWALASRRDLIHRRAPFVVVALGFLVARIVLPENAREGFVVLRLAWAAIEAAAMFLLIAHAGKIRRRWGALRAAGAHPIDALEQALAPALGAWPARLMAAELTVVGHAIAGWRQSAPPEDARTFSMHRRSHHATIVGVFLFLIIGESVALHLLVAPRSQTIAWLLTASSIWASLWLVGDAHALRLNPLRLQAEGLAVSVGARWRTFVPYDAIRSVALDDGAGRTAATLRATVGRVADVKLVLHRPLEARGLFGRTRSFDTLLLTVDRPEALIAALKA